MILMCFFLLLGPQCGLPKGYAFIEMSSIKEAASAIDKFHGALVRTRSLQVNYCDDKQQLDKILTFRFFRIQYSSQVENSF